MDTKTLKSLSQQELIQIIEELQLKAAFQAKGISDLQVDYKYLVENTSDVIFVLDSEGSLVYQNPASQTLFAYKRGEAIGMHYSTYLPAIEIERASLLFSSILREGKDIRNERMKIFDDDGKAIYFIANFTPIKSGDGGIQGLVGVLRNISEMHLMEKKLKENTRRLEEKVKEQIEQAEELKRIKTLNEEIISNAPIGIFMLDPSGIMLSANPALRVLMGHRPDQTRIGVNLSEYSGFVDAGLQRLLDTALLAKQPVLLTNVQYVPLSRDRTLTINVRMNPILDNEKKVKSVLVMVEDVTEQAKISSKMQRTEKLSAMGLLAAGVAYELKMPINLLTIDLNFLENNISDESPMTDYLKSMKDELGRIKQITEQLLNLGRPDEENKEVFEIHKIITSHPIQIILNRLEKNGYRVFTQYPDTSPNVRAVRSQLIQILLHLIANAEEAMPDKGELRIIVDTIKNGGTTFASITVEDTGMGIPPENLKKVFQPFFSTKGPKSTGLGLMVTYSIIENLGGTIGIKSEVGEGTSIKIILPAAEE